MLEQLISAATVLVLQCIEAKNMILLQPWLCNLLFNITFNLGNLIFYGHNIIL